MTYDPKENEKYHSKKMPPEWRTKLENFFTFNWRMIFMVLLLIFFFVFPFFIKEHYEDPPPPYDSTSR
jgi:hypothetical protein